MKTQFNLTKKSLLFHLPTEFAPFSIWILSALLFVGCFSEDDPIEPDNTDNFPSVTIQYEGVEEELWDYFIRFELAASVRGKKVDLGAARVTGKINEITTRNVAGTCNYNQSSPNKVTMDLDFWENSVDRNREFVVFHELGHCVLFRAHKEDATSNNICKSIMRSGTGNCIDNYSGITRESYLDELFDPAFEGDLFLASHEF